MKIDHKCWWFGINNASKPQRKSHVVYSQIKPLLDRTQETFDWPYHGKAKKFYQQMHPGDKVLFWMGDGKSYSNWGILGFGYIDSIHGEHDSSQYTLKVDYVPSVPLTPYPSGQRQETSETHFLRDVFGLNFRPLGKTFDNLGYGTTRHVITIDEVKKKNYKAVLKWTKKYDTFDVPLHDKTVKDREQAINRRIIVFNVGWMKNYQGLSAGLDSISSKTKFVDEKKWGYEIFNFLPNKNSVYGFVQPSGQKDYLERQIRVEEIDPSIGKGNKYIDNVLVVWVAPYPKGGTYVVGWYENARVYRNYQKSSLTERNFNDESLGYFVKADENNVICLPESDRLIEQLKVQRASAAKSYKGGLGHSCVWFARIDKSKPYNKIFRQNITNFIADYKQKNKDYFEKIFDQKINSSLKDDSGRKKRLENSIKKPKRIEVISTQFKRNPDVVAEVSIRAKGICEKCKNKAPFKRKNGEPYLEVHHKIRLADGGEDTIENAIALCPNCHRYLHYGVLSVPE